VRLQLNPLITPLASMSMPSAAGISGKPGMRMISPAGEARIVKRDLCAYLRNHMDKQK
jgi:hypothetical protein